MLIQVNGAKCIGIESVVVTVKLNDNREFKGRIIGTDKSRQQAITNELLDIVGGSVNN